MVDEEKYVRVRDGFRHPQLGEVGGWEGAVMRSFTAGDSTYLDIELSEKTLLNVASERKLKYFEDKIIFTRLRLTDRDVLPVASGGPQADRLASIAKVQKEWYSRVGAREIDYTQFAADQAYAQGEDVDEGRRNVLKIFGMVFVLLMGVYFMQCNDDDNNSGSSWGRGGGHYA